MKRNHVVCVRILRVLKRLESSQDLRTQPVLWQHAGNGFSQHFAASLSLHQLFLGGHMQVTRSPTVSVVLLVLHLIARRDYMLAVCDNYVVSYIHGIIINRFVFAHQSHGYRCSQPSDGSRVSGHVYVVPNSGKAQAGLVSML